MDIGIHSIWISHFSESPVLSGYMFSFRLTHQACQEKVTWEQMIAKSCPLQRSLLAVRCFLTAWSTKHDKTNYHEHHYSLELPVTTFTFGGYIILHVKKLTITTIIARSYPLQHSLFAVRCFLSAWSSKHGKNNYHENHYSSELPVATFTFGG